MNTIESEGVNFAKDYQKDSCNKLNILIGNKLIG